jgi:integrase
VSRRSTVAKAIARFEAYTRYKDFKTFHIEQAKAFKRDLTEQRGSRSAEPLSKATLYATLTALKRFFIALVGLPYFNPHSFRKTLALLGGRICKTPEEYKAWSQNLGHDHVLTTFSSYGDVSSYRQAEIIRAFSERGDQRQPAA